MTQSATPQRNFGSTESIASGVTPERLADLRRWNLGLTVLHAAQAVLILVMASDFAIAVTSTYPQGPPGTRLTTPEAIFDVRIGPAIAVFLLLAAFYHFATATFARRTYEVDLGQGINRFRWLEYSLSATLMLLLIASYSGITDITTVVAIAGANIAMVLFGWLQERMNPPGRTSTTMLPFWFGTIVGIAPWVAIWVNVIGADTVPGFVYGIYFSLLFLFFSFALNMWAHYARKGRFASVVSSERAYLVLSLVAKSLLAWQVFASALSG